MSNNQISEKLLNAAELFHYANKFRGQTFLILFKNHTDFLNLITDLKVLHKAQINLIVALEQESDFLQIEEACHFNIEFQLLSMVEEANIEEILEIQNKSFCPIVNLNSVLTTHFIAQLTSLKFINKVIFAGSYEPLIIDGQVKYFISKEDLLQKPQQTEPFNFVMKYLNLLQAQTDLVLIPAINGELFREIFTYLGAGTLITSQTEIVFKKALLKQVSQIYYILLNYIEEGLILAISEMEIAQRINDFFVLSIDDEVIGVVSIKIYEQAAEVAKLCTLPRYRNKGLASSLIHQVISYCQSKNLEYLFALSRNQKVLDIFRNFGFQDCPREELPLTWQSGYDFSRPSKACRLRI